MKIQQANRPEMIGHRGELLAELFLQDLEPIFVAKPTMGDIMCDFFVGFKNDNDGINICSVEVKATERPIKETFSFPLSQYRKMAYSNIPSLLLVIDVKKNTIYYAWPNREFAEENNEKNMISIKLDEVHEGFKEELFQKLVS